VGWNEKFICKASFNFDFSIIFVRGILSVSTETLMNPRVRRLNPTVTRSPSRGLRFRWGKKRGGRLEMVAVHTVALSGGDLMWTVLMAA
jgi:hypothetical protein